jgi:hypothetical protein
MLMPSLFTRATFLGCIAAIAGLGAIVLVVRAPSIPDDTQATAKFLLATCGDSAHNLDAVAQRAERQHWTSMIHPGGSENDPLKVSGMWRVEEDGHAYIVTTGVGPGDHTACQVEFEHPKPGRDDFFAAVSGALTLNVAGDFPGAGWRTEMYQIENLAPKNAVLLFVSSADGAVYRGAVMGN